MTGNGGNDPCGAHRMFSFSSSRIFLCLHSRAPLGHALNNSQRRSNTVNVLETCRSTTTNLMQATETFDDGRSSRHT